MLASPLSSFWKLSKPLSFANFQQPFSTVHQSLFGNVESALVDLKEAPEDAKTKGDTDKPIATKA